MSGPTTISLNANLDIGAAGPLADELVASLANGVVLDASAVVHLGGLCLQTLLSAATAYTANDRRFDIANPSAALTTALDEFGALPLLKRHLQQECAA